MQRDLDYALYTACQHGDLQQVQSLLKQGANVNAVCSEGNTPVHAAAISGDADVLYEVKIFYWNADLGALNEWGLTPLLAALDAAPSNPRGKYSSITQYLLRRCKPLSVDEYKTALEMAAGYLLIDVVDEILQNRRTRSHPVRCNLFRDARQAVEISAADLARAALAATEADIDNIQDISVNPISNLDDVERDPIGGAVPVAADMEVASGIGIASNSAIPADQAAARTEVQIPGADGHSQPPQTQAEQLFVPRAMVTIFTRLFTAALQADSQEAQRVLLERLSADAAEGNLYTLAVTIRAVVKMAALDPLYLSDWEPIELQADSDSKNIEAREKFVDERQSQLGDWEQRLYQRERELERLQQEVAHQQQQQDLEGSQQEVAHQQQQQDLERSQQEVAHQQQQQELERSQQEVAHQQQQQDLERSQQKVAHQEQQQELERSQQEVADWWPPPVVQQLPPVEVMLHSMMQNLAQQQAEVCQPLALGWQPLPSFAAAIGPGTPSQAVRSSKALLETHSFKKSVSRRTFKNSDGAVMGCAPAP